MPARFAIIGNPVAHSLSPLLHGAAFHALGIDASYDLLTIRTEDLTVAWEEQLRPHYDGFNVTLPLKSAVLPLLDKVEELATAVGAVNTVTRRGNQMIGSNTDILGIQASLSPLIERIRHKPAVVIGAGGTSRSVTAALASDVIPSRLTYLVRAPERASGVSALAASLLSCPFEVLALESPGAHTALSQAGLIVQTTPVGMAPETGRTPVPSFAGFRPGQVVFDVIYHPLETVFMRRAASAGCHVIGGLDLFLLQGAAAFERWLGRPMPLEAVRPAVLAALSS